MTARDRRALIVGVLVTAGALLALRVVPWSLRRASLAGDELRDRAGLLARTREEMASLPKLRDSAAVLSQALVALASEVLSGSSAAEAGSDLSARMNLAAVRAPARLERIDQLPDSSAAGRLGRVRMHAALESDVRGLVALLRAIDRADEVLMLDELRIQAVQFGGGERGPELLKIEVTVSGWYLRPRSPERQGT